jgi:hypothetical protein
LGEEHFGDRLGGELWVDDSCAGFLEFFGFLVSCV